jgi:hypothetical protein
MDTDATLLVVDGREAAGNIDELASVLAACGARLAGTVHYGVTGQEHAAAEMRGQTSTGSHARFTLTPSGGEAWSPPLSRA